MADLPMKPSDFETPLLDHPEHLKAIGIISVELGTMEFLLAALMGGLLGIDVKTADAVYSTPKSATARLEIITNILEIKEDVPTFFREEVEKIILKARGILGRRNDVIHNAWGAGPEGVQSIAFSKGSRQIKPIAIEELNNLIRDIRETSARIGNMRFLKPPSPDKHQPREDV